MLLKGMFVGRLVSIWGATSSERLVALCGGLVLPCGVVSVVVGVWGALAMVATVVMVMMMMVVVVVMMMMLL